MNQPIDENRVREIFREMAQDNQYQVSSVFYHEHNGTDAPKVPFSNLANNPTQFCAVKDTDGTTPVAVFSNGNAQFPMTIKGIFLISKDTTAGNITVKNAGNTIATIAKGTTSGAMVGATSLSNTTYYAGNAFTIVSDSAGNSTVFICFTSP